MKQDSNKEIKSHFKDEFSNLIDEFFDSMTKKLSEHPDAKMPTLTEIESMWGQLTTETRDLYSKMVGETISQMDESEAIALKT